MCMCVYIYIYIYTYLYTYYYSILCTLFYYTLLYYIIFYYILFHSIILSNFVLYCRQANGAADLGAAPEAWVEAVDSLGTHYWNYRTMACAHSLPPGVQATWVSRTAGSSRPYFHRRGAEVRELFWELPVPDLGEEGCCSVQDGLAGGWLEPGGAAAIDGLQNATRFNGHGGRLLGLRGEHYIYIYIYIYIYT